MLASSIEARDGVVGAERAERARSRRSAPGSPRLARARAAASRRARCAWRRARRSPRYGRSGGRPWCARRGRRPRARCRSGRTRRASPRARRGAGRRAAAESVSIASSSPTAPSFSASSWTSLTDFAARMRSTRSFCETPIASGADVDRPAQHARERAARRRLGHAARVCVRCTVMCAHRRDTGEGGKQGTGELPAGQSGHWGSSGGLEPVCVKRTPFGNDPFRRARQGHARHG